MPLRIDSHQHFWRYLPEHYPWMQPGWPIRRDFLPQHLGPNLKALGIDGAVSIELEYSPEPDKITEWVAEAYRETDKLMRQAGLRS